MARTDRACMRCSRSPGRSPMASSSLQRLLGALSVAAMPCWAHGAPAAYPEGPGRVVLPTAPGAASDAVARICSTKLSEVVGQQFIGDNGPGAGGIIAVEPV